MRIAVVQLSIQPNRRTATLQAALNAIDAAAKTDPAPDIILLPAFADVLHSAPGQSAPCEHVEGQTTAACGLRARNWGVFIAFGMAEKSENRPYLTSVLLDRDGDVRLAQRQMVLQKSSADFFQPGEGISVTNILLGRIGLLTGEDWLNPRAWDHVNQAGAQLVVGAACRLHPGDKDTNPRKTRARIAEQARRTNLGCAVADATTGDESNGPGLSTIIDNQGEILAAAPPGETATLWAEIHLPEQE
ncbi:MAG: carbon-nitrogen hydrolase family protein [Phycisphaerae bacterium]